ncbi:FUSC family protein [Pedobacter insulae]|nr:FUSC family membrane protein [Pedobacter insulae]
MANRKGKEIRLFFAELGGEELSDALRNTMAIIMPLLVFFYLGMPQLAIGIATGTLLIANADLPGNRSDKLQGAWLAILLFPTVAIVTVLCLSQIILLSVWIGLLTFSLMMTSVFGQRIGAIGLLSVILATFTIGLHPASALNYGFYIFLGVIWYHLVSLTQIMLLPYRSLTRALRKCTKQTAALMELRASGYDPTAPLSGFNERNIRLHLKVNASHELIRRLLLSDNLAMREESIKGKKMLAKSMALIDLYEQASAVHHDYPYLRATLAGSNALELIGDSIICLAKQLDKGVTENKELLDDKIAKLVRLSQGSDEKSELIGKLLANLRQTRLLVEKVNGQKHTVGDPSILRFQEFISEEGFNWELLLKELNIDSPIFRFALRLAILLAFSIVILFVFPGDRYGYWLPLTLIVVSRPSYGPTKKRNIERIVGTLIGLVVGWGVLVMTDSNTFQLLFAAAFLYSFFVFFNSRYWLSAMGITAAVVLSLAVYHGHPLNILSDRLLFTLMGCTMGVFATFLFPIWQSGRLKDLFVKVLIANRDYLYQVSIADEENGMHQVRLARKRAYQTLSVLSEAMLLSATEPKWKRVELGAARQIQLLCFQCNGLIAAMSSGKDNRSAPYDQHLLDGMDQCIAQCIKSDLPNWKAVGYATTASEQPMEISGVITKLYTCFSK